MPTSLSLPRTSREAHQVAKLEKKLLKGSLALSPLYCSELIPWGQGSCPVFPSGPILRASTLRR